ncbi:MAG: amidophosphoribosyltransferase [bacterium]|jgi:amidophosphoribosyltransferase|nr:amidophosphoribosyltransferase [Bacillota bacterium]
MPPLKVREKCGVFGIYAPGEDVGRLTYMGLFALQHRGQESAGIAITDGRTIVLEKDRGLVAEVFTPERQQRLHGKLAIGHVLYGNTDTQSNVENAEPLAVMSRRGSLALAHNGEITNADALRAELSRRGYLFRTDSDIEVIASLVAQAEDPDLTSALISTLRKLNGAYALVVLTPDRIMGIRDPHGIRPLSLGRFDGGYVLASETCAFDTVGAQFIRPVEPGELVTIGPDGISSQRFAPGEKAVCTFEYIYFARPDSLIEGIGVHGARRRAGRILASEHPAKADMVISVPDSGTSAALGYAEAAGIPLDAGLIKNRYVGRTFIKPSQKDREFAVQLKLSPLQEVLAGKSVVMVDDSIVRGTTCGRLVRMLKKAGVKNVHVRVASPPVISPCYYGIDTPYRQELVAAQLTIEAIRTNIGADSLGFLSTEGLKNAIGLPDDPYCMACFSGHYPAGRPDKEEEE